MYSLSLYVYNSIKDLLDGWKFEIFRDWVSQGLRPLTEKICAAAGAGAANIRRLFRPDFYWLLSVCLFAYSPYHSHCAPKAWKINIIYYCVSRFHPKNKDQRTQFMMGCTKPCYSDPLYSGDPAPLLTLFVDLLFPNVVQVIYILTK